MLPIAKNAIFVVEMDQHIFEVLSKKLSFQMEMLNSIYVQYTMCTAHGMHGPQDWISIKVKTIIFQNMMTKINA